MRRKLLFLFCLSIVGQIAFADSSSVDWSFGIAGGYRNTSMSISNIDKDLFPTSTGLSSGLFSIFVQAEFLKERNLAIRPQISFLNRGGGYKDLTAATFDDEEEFVTYDDEVYKEKITGKYKIKAHYVDVRIPVIYNFLKAQSVIRPYVYVAPVFGFATGGSICLQEETTIDPLPNTTYYEGNNVEITSANFSSSYFAGQVGVGVKFSVPVADQTCYLGIEASYEYGFSNTYGSKEKSGDVYDVSGISTRSNKANGSRKFSGFEISAVVSVPVTIFKAKKIKCPETTVQYIETYTPQPEVVAEEKPCYTLDEITDMIANGKDVNGLTICAVDAITFEFAKSTIKASSYDYLDKLADLIIKTGKRIEVKGHTDNVGSEESNLELSKQRAWAVVEYLVSKGVDTSKLSYSYYGESKPLTSNNTENGRAINRRVEFTILDN